MPHDEVVMYLIFRADLKLPKGKLAAQAGHAVQMTIRAVEDYADGDSRRHLATWENGSYTKLALQVANADELGALGHILETQNILYTRVVDEGRTVVDPGTVTVLGIQPLPKSKIGPLVQHLKLL